TVTQDQRGVARPQGPACDMGAYELLTTTASVSGFTPSSGLVGITVTVMGTHFAGATAVKFGGVDAASFHVLTPGKLTAVVPTGAVTGVISVTAGGTGSSTDSFTVLPKITSF